jgi:glycosyltransferase involved in cell wall biosynthesis
MRIVAISASQVPANTANSLQAMKAVHALAQLGHDVHLIVPEKPDAQAEQTKVNLQAFYGLKQPFPVEYLPSASRRLFFWDAVQHARRYRPNLLYIWPLQAAALGLLFGMPVVLEMHDLPSGPFGPFWYRFFRFWPGKKRMAVVTRALQQALDERFGAFPQPGCVILAPNGVEPERYAQLPDPPTARRLLELPEALTVACVGHLYPGRGVELFLELAGRLGRGVRFLWVGGRPEDVETWRTKVESQGLSNVTFTGFIHNAQLPLYQAAADILLMPYGREIGISSGGGNSAQISSPMKMFEYLATGRAIVASDQPVFHEVLNENNSAFCPPEKVSMWEGAIRALLDDPLRRAFLAKQARADAAQYAWTARAARILDGFVESGK